MAKMVITVIGFVGMDLRSIPLFSVLNRSMGWLSHNHQVLAENIANADTPDYTAKKLEPLDFKRLLPQVKTEPVAVTQTSESHLAGFRPAPSPHRPEDLEQPYDVTPTGNAVSLEEQAVLVAKNAMDYQLASTIYSKSLGMLKSALGRGN